MKKIVNSLDVSVDKSSTSAPSPQTSGAFYMPVYLVTIGPGLVLLPVAACGEPGVVGLRGSECVRGQNGDSNA